MPAAPWTTPRLRWWRHGVSSRRRLKLLVAYYEYMVLQGSVYLLYFCTISQHSPLPRTRQQPPHRQHSANYPPLRALTGPAAKWGCWKLDCWLVSIWVWLFSWILVCLFNNTCAQHVVCAYLLSHKSQGNCMSHRSSGTRKRTHTKSWKAALTAMNSLWQVEVATHACCCSTQAIGTPNKQVTWPYNDSANFLPD